MRRLLLPLLLSAVAMAALPQGRASGDDAPEEAARDPGDSPVGAVAGARRSVAVMTARALFAPDARTLSVAGEAALERLVERLIDDLSPDESIVSIRVVGHADSAGPADYNLRLSKRRAAAVAEALASRRPGVPTSVEGMGESSPVASDATPEGRRRNRRVEIFVVTMEGVDAAFRAVAAPNDESR